MELIISMLIAAAAATSAYVARLKRMSKSEQKSLNKQILEEFEARHAAEDTTREVTEANAQLKADLECKDKRIDDLVGKVTALESRLVSTCSTLS